MSDMTVVQSFAALLTADSQAQQTKLSTFKALLQAHDKATIQEALRQAKKPETVAPLRQALLDKGMAEGSAKTRHMEVATLHKAWVQGFSIEGQSDWNKAVEAARAYRKAQSDNAAVQKEEIAIGAEFVKNRKNGMAVEDAEKLAADKVAELKANNAANRAVESAEKSLGKVGVSMIAFPTGSDYKEVAEAIYQALGIVNAGDVAVYLQSYIEAKEQEAKQQQEAKTLETEATTITAPTFQDDTVIA
jgi:hypothetical protein